MSDATPSARTVGAIDASRPRSRPSPPWERHRGFAVETVNGLASLERDFLNRFQGGFPLTERPFQQAAEALETAETTLMATIATMLDRRLLSRFGPLYNAERMGGCFTLAAMKVPESDFERIAAILDGIPEVAHNYRRGHALNMWFVLATRSKAALNDAILRLQTITGLKVYNFPKEREYQLGFWLHLENDGSVGVRRVERVHTQHSLPPDRLDRALISATQAGLPLVPRPFAQVAEQIGCDAPTVISRFMRLLESGAVRRIGAVPNHYRLGLRGNGMSVWDIDDTHVDALGEQFGALDFVSHCYRRPRRLPLWPYNLFAMVHGRDRAEVMHATARLETIVSAHCRNHCVIFSDAILKKTGLRVFHADALEASARTSGGDPLPPLATACVDEL